MAAFRLISRSCIGWNSTGWYERDGISRLVLCVLPVSDQSLSYLILEFGVKSPTASIGH